MIKARFFRSGLFLAHDFAYVKFFDFSKNNCGNLLILKLISLSLYRNN